MNNFYDWFHSLSNTTVGFWTSVAIFLITLILVSRRLIGFTITLLLLLFTLAAGLAISNRDLMRNYLQNNQYATPYQTELTGKWETFQKDLLQSFDAFKSEIDEKYKKLQDQIDKLNEKKPEESPAKKSTEPEKKA